MPDSDLTGLVEPLEDWPAALPRDATAVTPLEPRSRKAQCGSLIV